MSTEEEIFSVLLENNMQKLILSLIIENKTNEEIIEIILSEYSKGDYDND